MSLKYETTELAVAKLNSLTHWLFALVVTVQAVAIVLGIFATAYFPGYSLIEMYGHFSNDAWCNTEVEGIGIHCGGDYFYPLVAIDLGNPYSNEFQVPISYPPGAFFATSWIRDISHVLPIQNASLLMFYFWTTLLALVPSLIVLFKRNLSSRILGLLSVPLLFMSVGFIAAIDRANNLTFAIPFIVIFIYGVARNSILLVTLGMVFGVNLRPQFIVFAIVLVSLRRYRHLAVSIVASVFTFLLSFFAWPNVSGKTMLSDWFRNTSAYSTYSLPSQVDDNLSLTHGLHAAMTWLGTDAPWSFSSRSFALLDSSGSMIWIFLIPLITVLHFFVGKRLSLTELVFNAISLVIIIPGTTFPYYLVWFAVIPVAIVIDIEQGKTPLSALVIQRLKNPIGFSQMIKVLTYSTIFLTFVPFPFTKSLITSCEGCADASLSMMVLPLFLFIQVFLNLHSGNKTQTSS